MQNTRIEEDTRRQRGQNPCADAQEGEPTYANNKRRMDKTGIPAFSSVSLVEANTSANSAEVIRTLTIGEGLEPASLVNQASKLLRDNR